MIKKKLTKVAITTFALSLLLLTGCGKDKKETEATTTENAVINLESEDSMNAPSDVSVVTKEGYVLSEFTGEWIDESIANQRPIVITINNISDCLPQSGISQADITYEMMVEGGITRLLCVFKDYGNNLEKLGPVRSARPYYVRTAQMLYGIFTHYGWSTVAEQIITNEGVTNMNGVSGEGGVVFYRDESRNAPHNVYTNSERLVDGVEYMGYDPEYSDYFDNTFNFYLEDTDLEGGQTANKVRVGFNSSFTPWFEYDSATKKYLRFEYGGPQIDDQTGEQLSYKNILFVKANYISLGDGLYDIDFLSGGTGYYISNGKYVPITWKYDNYKAKYYDESGAELKMNPGQTFVEYVPNDTGFVEFE